ncbi:MAG: peptide deformylase [Chlamydiia bacterium]
MQTPSLSIVTLGDPILRRKAAPLTRDKIRSPEIQQLIRQMRETLGSLGVGLAAPQVGVPFQLIVVQDSGELMRQRYTPEQLAERERVPVPFQALFNPTLQIVDSAGSRAFFEGCLSIPQMLAVVPRAHTVQVEALDHQGLAVRFQASGWFARMLQHEVDHLHGILYTDRMVPETFMTFEHFDRTWKQKPIAEVLTAFGVNTER